LYILHVYTNSYVKTHRPKYHTANLEYLAKTELLQVYLELRDYAMIIMLD